MTLEEYTKSLTTLNLWSHMYYDFDDPIASDDEYDKLYHKVKAYELEHPEHLSKYLPTQHVGSNSFHMFIEALRNKLEDYKIRKGEK